MSAEAYAAINTKHSPVFTVIVLWEIFRVKGCVIVAYQ